MIIKHTDVDEMESDNDGVWITIAGHLVKVRVVGAELGASMWERSNEDLEPVTEACVFI